MYSSRTYRIPKPDNQGLESSHQSHLDTHRFSIALIDPSSFFPKQSLPSKGTGPSPNLLDEHTTNRAPGYDASHEYRALGYFATSGHLNSEGG